MKFSIYTLGCKVNTYEAESVAGELCKKGYKRVKNNEKSDIALVFTCAVTASAAAKSRKVLHSIRRKNPDAVTVLIGCYAQMNDGRVDEADIIVGTGHKHEIPEIIEEYFQKKVKIREVDDMKNISFEPLLPESFYGHSRAALKIQDGCNQFCSYCIIPYLRGRERSMDPDMAVAEADRLSKNYPEIVLSGIHTGRYGREYNLTLSSLMRRILNETDIKRLRISSIEMTEVSDELIALMKEEPLRIARHLHIPLQSGSDSVLKRMHRPYDTDTYYNRVMEIRRQLPGVSISCDLMVGFPGESEQEFQETAAFIQKCAFSFLHVFPYSSRPGTPAAEMKDQVNDTVKKERAEKMIALSQQLYDAYQTRMVGHESDVITEHEKNGITPGHTSEYIPVVMKEKMPYGQYVHARMYAYRNHMMYAEKMDRK